MKFSRLQLDSDSDSETEKMAKNKKFHLFKILCALQFVFKCVHIGLVITMCTVMQLWNIVVA